MPILVGNHDSLAEWSKALASGASPQGRGFEPHSCHGTNIFMLVPHVSKLRAAYVHAASNAWRMCTLKSHNHVDNVFGSTPSTPLRPVLVTYSCKLPETHVSGPLGMASTRPSKAFRVHHKPCPPQQNVLVTYSRQLPETHVYVQQAAGGDALELFWAPAPMVPLPLWKKKAGEIMFGCMCSRQQETMH